MVRAAADAAGEPPSPMSSSKAHLQSVLEASLTRFPAVAVAAVHRDRVVCTAAAGTAGQRARDRDPDPAAPATSPERTLFLTASISKVVLAVVCLQCRDRAELDLDRDVKAYLRVPVRHPAFPDAPLTLRHLLTHTSGLADDEAALLPGRWRTAAADCPVPLEEYVAQRLVPGGAAFEGRLWDPACPPGGAPYHYSNAGFTLAAYAVECAVGQSVPSLARQRIFAPLAMQRTTYSLAEGLALPDADVAVPHDAGLRPVGHYGCAEWPAAGLRSTAGDLARFLRAFSRGPAECPVLSEASLREMLPADFTRGLAWWGRDAWYGDRRGHVWTHGGFMEGVRTHMYLWPASRSGMVILTNGSHEYTDIAEALEAVLKEAVGESAS